SGHHLTLHSFPTRRSSDLTTAVHGREEAHDTAIGLQEEILARVGRGGLAAIVGEERTIGAAVDHEAAASDARGLRLDQVEHQLRSEEHTSELQSRENLVCR